MAVVIKQSQLKELMVREDIVEIALEMNRKLSSAVHNDAEIIAVMTIMQTLLEHVMEENEILITEG